MPTSLALTSYTDSNSQGGSHTETERGRETGIDGEGEKKYIYCCVHGCIIDWINVSPLIYEET